MGSIGDLIRRVGDEEPPPNDLLNADYPCRCGRDGCNDPMPKNPDRGPGR